MNSWFHANKQSLNIKKTKYAIFSSNRNTAIPDNYAISLNDSKLEYIGNGQPEKSIKFLGAHMDENLTWAAHIRMVRSKLSRPIFALNKIKNIFPHDIMKSLYYSLIHSHLVYGIQAWGNASSINPV